MKHMKEIKKSFITPNILMTFGVIVSLTGSFYLLFTGIIGAFEGWKDNNMMSFVFNLAKAILFEFGILPGIPIMLFAISLYKKLEGKEE